MTHRGILTFWYEKQGMGFIRSPTVRGDVWIHYSVAPKDVRFERGMEIEFEVVASCRGPQATHARVLSEKNIVPRESKQERERRMREEQSESRYQVVAWRLLTPGGDGHVNPEIGPRYSVRHFRDPLWENRTLCGQVIREDAVTDAIPDTSRCKICVGRANKIENERVARR